ncbi:hypothetical protein HX870_13400 [Pseudomonas gingeri]|uniref:hypothetical protein n=1 Tax=Pseudomonas gingeri TaxID=117681 RepID=UPI0015A25D5A|nr:hypothetical protein [Pseudomonas gingeri]NWA23304.1 hypothetical protein [Pseudomonas gingeri]NWD68591.1 hypothetical protein [Pseudomonas gingeri]
MTWRWTSVPLWLRPLPVAIALKQGQKGGRQGIDTSPPPWCIQYSGHDVHAKYRFIYTEDCQKLEFGRRDQFIYWVFFAFFEMARRK